MMVVNVETTYITDSNLYTTRNIAPAHGPLVQKHLQTIIMRNDAQLNHLTSTASVSRAMAGGSGGYEE